MLGHAAAAADLAFGGGEAAAVACLADEQPARPSSQGGADTTPSIRAAFLADSGIGGADGQRLLGRVLPKPFARLRSAGGQRRGPNRPFQDERIG